MEWMNGLIWWLHECQGVKQKKEEEKVVFFFNLLFRKYLKGLVKLKDS